MVRSDCLYFRGDKPCSFNRLCDCCPHFEAFPQKILIIKCRAQGDVLRTTPILPALKKKYGPSHITWVTDPESIELLAHNPFINRLRPFDLENVLALLGEKFDLLLSLDKEEGPTHLATRVKAKQKFGFGRNELGHLTILNEASAYALRLGVDDELKFHQNQKSYQEIIHEMADLPFERAEYVFDLPEEAKQKANRFIKRNRIPETRPWIGLNTGAGTKFETKQWPVEYFAELISLLKQNLKAPLFLLGGEREKTINLRLERQSKAKIFNTGHDNSLLEFAGFISMLDIVVSSDTLAMHLAIALKKKVVALFGPTSPAEVDLYGRGIKIFAGAPCAPCYKQNCSDRQCLKAISPAMVLEAIQALQ
ncbi:MAG: glycosyltransferase family 9 protein [Candidatus Aminicenantales bacterium]